MKDTVASLRDMYGCGAELTTDRVQNKLSSMTNVDRWKQNVSAEFDNVWEETLDAPKDPHQEETAKDLRTCNVTLKQIVRPEMSAHLKDFQLIARRRQDELTGVTREVAVLAQKTILVVSEGYTGSQPSLK